MKSKSFIALGIILVLVIIAVIVSRSYNASQATTTTSSSEQENPIIAESTIDQQFEFPSQNAQGRVDENISLRIAKAEVTKEVLVQGTPAKAKGEKAFLVLHLEIDNDTTEPKYLSPHNLFRLITQDGKQYAPDIHSNTVEVQPISTKITRIGFVVTQDQRQFALRVGELEGEKQEIQINF